MPKPLKKWLLILLKTGMITSIFTGGIVLVGLLVNLASYRNKLIPPFIFPIPSAESIGRRYLQAVAQENLNYLSEDKACVHSQLRQHITQYGDTELQYIAASAEWYSGNNDHQYELTTVTFKYRSSMETLWQKDKFRLMTATNLERSNSLPDALPFRWIHCAKQGLSL